MIAQIGRLSWRCGWIVTQRWINSVLTGHTCTVVPAPQRSAEIAGVTSLGLRCLVPDAVAIPCSTSSPHDQYTAQRATRSPPVKAVTRPKLKGTNFVAR